MLVVVGEDVVGDDPLCHPPHGSDAGDQTHTVLLGTEYSGLSHSHDHSFPSHTIHSLNHPPVVVWGPTQRMASRTAGSFLVVHR